MTTATLNFPETYKTSTSHAFPALLSEVMTDFLSQSKPEGQPAAVRSFQTWLQAQIRQ